MPQIEKNLADGITADGTYPASRYHAYSGEYAIAIYGTLDGATVEIVFYTEDPSGTMHELPQNTDFVFTAIQAPAGYIFPQGMAYKVKVSNAGASTNVGVNLHKIRDLY